MEKTFWAEASILIQVPAARVWMALTTPELIKQYLFGTEAVSDWQIGSTITYRGTWEGKTYEDKGKILELEPEKHLLTTYWSSFSGLPDAPESYQTVAYDLTPEGSSTKLTITQDNIKSEGSRDHSAKNWQMVLESLKKLLEK
ncbi:MAG: SRPBCC domain-containing protein [Patescibacteria group bacterium]|nr:SRPBCC domain-containing protein [Patescibacteria group bacterium]